MILTHAHDVCVSIAAAALKRDNHTLGMQAELQDHAADDHLSMAVNLFKYSIEDSASVTTMQTKRIEVTVCIVCCGGGFALLCMYVQGTVVFSALLL